MQLCLMSLEFAPELRGSLCVVVEVQWMLPGAADPPVSTAAADAPSSPLPAHSHHLCRSIFDVGVLPVLAGVPCIPG